MDSEHGPVTVVGNDGQVASPAPGITHASQTLASSLLSRRLFPHPLRPMLSYEYEEDSIHDPANTMDIDSDNLDDAQGDIDVDADGVVDYEQDVS